MQTRTRQLKSSDTAASHFGSRVTTLVNDRPWNLNQQQFLSLHSELQLEKEPRMGGEAQGAHHASNHVKVKNRHVVERLETVGDVEQGAPLPCANHGAIAPVHSPLQACALSQFPTISHS